MAKECVVQELSGDEANDYEMATLQEIDEAEKTELLLPSSCSSGHGVCESGYCYVCCDNRWYRLVDSSNNQYTCSQGRGRSYECGSRVYVATC